MYPFKLIEDTGLILHKFFSNGISKNIIKYNYENGFAIGKKNCKVKITLFNHIETSTYHGLYYVHMFCSTYRVFLWFDRF